jgi:hypothetical protein
MNTSLAHAAYRRDLGDGLVLRWSTAADTDNIAQLASMVFRDSADAAPNFPLANLMHMLMSGTHPVMGPGDVALVEDTRKQGNPLVACTCLWRHAWEYEGIPFGIGRPEIVASDPDYRHKRLVRAVFELIHARSEAEGHLAQGITGIPYFYRLFGYEYALDLGGGCSTYVSLIPQVPEGPPELYTARDATPEDIPLLQQLYARRCSSSIVSGVIDEAWWRFQMSIWPTSESDETWHTQIITDSAGNPQGYFIIQNLRWGASLRVLDLAFAEGANLPAIAPSFLRALVAQGAQLPVSPSTTEPLSMIEFQLGESHPIYDVLGKQLANVKEAPYAWYVRVPHLPTFLKHIAPVLERRLANSPVAGYSGVLIVDLYRGGLRMVFDRGKLITVEDWRRPVWAGRSAVRFPPMVFLQALFGYRSLDALRAAFPDVIVNDDMELLVKTLFPSRPSWVLNLG